MFHMDWFNQHLEKPSRLSFVKLLGDDIHTYLVGKTILTFSTFGDDYICSRKKLEVKVLFHGHLDECDLSNYKMEQWEGGF